MMGCQQDNSISQIHNFNNNTWERFNFLNFDFQVEEVSKAYDIIIVLRYNEDFPKKALLVNLVMTLPSGEERIREYKLSLRDKDEKMLGEKKTAYYERFITIREDLLISEPGQLKFEIENLMSNYFTQGVVEFGIILRSAN